MKIACCCLLIFLGQTIYAQQFRSYLGANEKVGVMDSLGNVITPAIYKYAAAFGSNLCQVQTEKGVGLIDAEGNTVITPHYIGMGDLHDGLSWVGERDASGLHFGYINEDGLVVIPLDYSNADDFHEGIARVEKNGKVRFINKTGRLAMTQDFDRADVFHGGVAAVFEDGLWGVVNTTGTFVVQPIYKLVSTLPDGKTIIGVADRNEAVSYNQYDVLFGMADEKGREIIPPTYHDVGFWSDGVLCVRMNGKWGLVDSTGTVILPPTYPEELPKFISGYTVSKSDTSLINNRGQKIDFGPGVRFVMRNDNIATIRKGKLYGFARLSGEIFVEPIYEQVAAYSEGLVGVRKNGKWGFLNLNGEAITPFIYSGFSPFTGGRAVVILPDPANTSRRKSGFIDRQGYEIVPANFERVYSFNGGFAITISNGVASLIDSMGRVVVSGKDVRYPKEGMIPVSDGKWGFADLNGKMVIPCQFDESQYFSEGFAAVKQGGRWGYIDRNGASITPFIYNHNINSFENGFAKVYSQTAGREVLINKAGVEIGVAPFDPAQKGKKK